MPSSLRHDRTFPVGSKGHSDWIALPKGVPYPVFPKHIGTQAGGGAAAGEKLYGPAQAQAAFAAAAAARPYVSTAKPAAV